MGSPLWASNIGTGLAYCFMLSLLVFGLYFNGTYFYFYWHAGPEALDRWAKEGGYRIVRRERRMYRKGPFFWGTGNCQIVYRIEVQDRHGTQKSGWVRIGSYWWPDPNRIDVRWDEPSPSPPVKSEASGRGQPVMWDPELDGL